MICIVSDYINSFDLSSGFVVSLHVSLIAADGR